MITKWNNCLLGDVLTFQRGYDLPKSKMVHGKYPVVGSNGIIGYHNEYTTENPSITIGRSGNTGNPFIVYGRSWSHNTTLYVKDFKDSDPVFVYYLLKTLDLGNFAGGSAVPTLNRNHIHTLNISVPPLTAQQQISATLSALDAKIANNKKINHNLEEMAQAIFKAWFVDFVPNGTLGEIIELFDFKRVPLSGNQRSQMDKIYPYYGAATLMDYVDNYIFDGIYLLLGEDGTVITDLGFPVLQYVWGKFCVNNHAHVLQGRNGYSTESLYILLQQTNVQAAVTGAVQLKINQTNLRAVPVFIPTVEQMAEYNEIISPMFAQLRMNYEDNKRLAEIRNSLLPRLISGELQIANPIETN